MEANQYCTAAFLDISQAFDKVWHKGFLCELNTLFPYNIHQMLKSYLANRRFLIKYMEPSIWPNAAIRRDLQVPTFPQEVRSYSVTYRRRLDNHPNSLATLSLFHGQNCNRRLKRQDPADLASSF
jgi:hypothetical protein